MTYDQDAIATTIIAALNTAYPAQVNAYDWDDVPAEHPARYTQVDVSRRFVPERRLGGDVMVPGSRLVTRYSARSVSDLREIRRLTMTALEGVILSGDVGPFVFESEDPMQTDDGWLTAADAWTFA